MAATTLISSGLTGVALTGPVAAAEVPQPTLSADDLAHKDFPAAPVVGHDARGDKGASRPGAPGRGIDDLKLDSSAPAGYLLKLDAVATTTVLNRVGGGAAAKRAARAQLDRVETLQDQVVADLPRDSKVLYKTHAIMAGVAVSARDRKSVV